MRRVLLALALSACGRTDVAPFREAPSHEAQPASTCALAPARSLRVPADGAPADVLFVVDNSADMASFQAKLAAGAAAFIDAIAPGTDYRIGVVSADTARDGGGREQAGARRSSYSPDPPYVVREIENAACRTINVLHGCFRAPLITHERPREERVARLAEAVRLGTCGDGANESGSLATLVALENGRPGRCNETFFRERAKLVLIMLSSEDDGAGNPREPKELLDAIARSKRLELVRLASLAGFADGAPAACRTGAPDCGSVCRSPLPEGSGREGCRQRPDRCTRDEYCDESDRCRHNAIRFAELCNWCAYFNAPDCCEALPADRYLALGLAHAEALANKDPRFSRSCRPGAGELACWIGSACAASYDGALREIARELVSAAPSRFVKTGPIPDPKTLLVRLGGRALVAGRDYLVRAEGVELASTLELRAGDLVELFCGGL